MLIRTTRVIAAFLPGLALLIVAPISIAAGGGTIELRSPQKGAAVRLVGKREIRVPGDSSVFVRTGFEPLIFMPGEFDRQTFETRGPLAVIRGAKLEKLSGLWSIGAAGVEARAPLGEREPYVVLTGPALGGYGTEQVLAIPLGRLLDGAGEDAAIKLPTGLRSPLLVRSGIRLLATGYTREEKQDGVATMAPGAGVQQAQSVAIYDVAAGKPRMLGMVESFSEHAENNLASGVTQDGILHMIATEVLVSKNNHSRVHHLRFDTTRGVWLDARILFTRSEFTSTNTPRLVVTGDTVDAFWLPEGGSSKMSTDGLYAYRVGDATTWRLHDARGEYAALPNADGRGALLIGVAANPDRDGKIRWFLRRNATWISAGETDLGDTVYSLTIDGTEPFGLWRDSAGGVHAAFLQSEKLLIVDLKLPR
jgi:hypothetical protein